MQHHDASAHVDQSHASADVAANTTVNRPASPLLPGGAASARTDYLVFGLISVCALILTAVSAWRSTFWLDEVSTMGVIAVHSPAQVLSSSLSMSDPIPPLYYLLLWVWDKGLLVIFGAPLSEGLLILPSAVCSAGAIFVTGLAARQLLGGGLASWLTCLLCATSVSWTRIGTELRYYALLHLFVALIALFYLQLRAAEQVDGAQDRRRLHRLRWLLGLFMALAAFTGYGALFLLAGFAICEATLILMRRARLSALLPYFFACVWYSPWIAIMGYEIVSGHIRRNFTGTGSVATPTLSSFGPVYSTLLGNPGVIALYLFAIMLVIMHIAALRRQPHSVSVARFHLVSLTVFNSALVLMLLIVYVYSAFIFPQGSIFRGRYFYLAYPMLCLTMGYAIKTVMDALKPQTTPRALIIYAAICTLAVQQVYPYVSAIAISTKPTEQPYLQATEYLRQQADIESAGVAVYMPGMSITVRGWDYYYVTKQHTVPGFPVSTSVPTQAHKVYVCAPSGRQPNQVFFDKFVLQSHLQDLGIWVFVAPS